MASSLVKTPIMNEGNQFPFKVPPVPRKPTDRLSRVRGPLSKVQLEAAIRTENSSCGGSSSIDSPCVQLGKKRQPIFPFSPARNQRTPKSASARSGSTRFFCEDDWTAFKENIEKFAVATTSGPRLPTPPAWVATPHRSGLHRRQAAAKSECKYATNIRRRLTSVMQQNVATAEASSSAGSFAGQDSLVKIDGQDPAAFSFN